MGKTPCRITSMWTVERLAPSGEWETIVKSGPNLMLNEGLQRLIQLLIAGGGTGYNNANARIGVGTGTAGSNATMTGLVGASTYFQGMDVSYPSVSSQTVTFRATVAAGSASFEWAEMTVDNGAVADENLNREVFDADDRETKGAGEIWRATCAITFA